MPWLSAKRERVRRAVSVLLTAAIAGSAMIAAARASDLPRIASINACTDQLLLALADPEQILGLGPYSRDTARSWGAADAHRYPRLSGEAEDVLVLKPDVVVAGSFTKLATRTLLKEQGLRLVTFDVAHSLDEVKAQLRQMGELTGHPDRAAALNARIDAAAARTRQLVARGQYSVLSISRRGWVSGSRSLISSLLAEVGLSNAAGELGLKYGGFASLEAIISLRPDFILVSNDSEFAEDEGRAFLLHPALERFYPPSKRLVVPERMTVCGGPMVVDALDRLVAELERVERTASAPARSAITTR
ncbi:MAG: iron ABC transporter [Rhizobiales bacterium 62-47]|nr:ABC transporter substrate-binding protein [Hyphomicrobiales bacterium]OJY14003.1 MAG: iron ABC transporter [Rhizobiales bacterium 62-47]